MGWGIGHFVSADRHACHQAGSIVRGGAPTNTFNPQPPKDLHSQELDNCPWRAKEARATYGSVPHDSKLLQSALASATTYPPGDLPEVLVITVRTSKVTTKSEHSYSEQLVRNVTPGPDSPGQDRALCVSSYGQMPVK